MSHIYCPHGLLMLSSTHCTYITPQKLYSKTSKFTHVVPMVQWNALYLIRTSNQWFHHHREPTKMYSKGADTFVSLELLVQVMPSIYMEGRSYCCCSRPNQQIKVVHCRPCNPTIHIQLGIFIHCRHYSREEQSREWNGRRRPADGGGEERRLLKLSTRASRTHAGCTEEQQRPLHLRSRRRTPASAPSSTRWRCSNVDDAMV